MAKIISTISFGIEFECVKLSSTALVTIQANKFERHLDHSITGDLGEELPRIWPDAGSEIVTPPYIVPVSMNGDGSSLNMDMDDNRVIETVSALSSCSAHINSSCGVHIHLGRPKQVVENGVTKTISYWSPDEVRTMLIIGQILEPKLWKLVHKSRLNNSTCESITKRYSKNDMGQFYPLGKVDPVKYSNKKRYCWLNLIETQRKGNRPERGYGGSPATGTIEIRMLGETDNQDYIFQWLKLWLKIASLVAYAPNTLAISNCCFSEVLESDFVKLESLFVSECGKRTLALTQGQGVHLPLIPSMITMPTSVITMPQLTRVSRITRIRANPTPPGPPF